MNEEGSDNIFFEFVAKRFASQSEVGNRLTARAHPTQKRDVLDFSWQAATEDR